MTCWAFRGVLLEVAWRLPVPRMLHGFSCWIFLDVQARMGINRKTSDFSGWTMHEGFLFRALHDGALVCIYIYIIYTYTYMYRFCHYVYIIYVYMYKYRTLSIMMYFEFTIKI